MRRSVKKTLRVVRKPFEWFGIFLGFAVFTFLPRKGMLRVCDFVSSAMYRFDKKGRRFAEENLAVMYGRLPRRSDLIVRRSYRNMARTVGYAFWTCIRGRIRAEQSGVMSHRGCEFLAANKPAVTVSGHIGCWEILSQLAYLQGHSMMSVAKDIGSRGMTSVLMRARRSIGQEIVHADGAFRPLMAGVKAGKSLGLLVDQLVMPKDGGIWVRFFGRPVPVSAAPAFFSAKGKAPIVIAWSRPLKDGRWRCEVVADYKPEDAKDIWRMTQTCISHLERVIRRHPSCWVLNYRYFRMAIPGDDLHQLEQRESKCKVLQQGE